MLKFEMRTVDEIIPGATLDRLDETGEDLTEAHVETDASDYEPAELDEALDALASQVWDSCDWRVDSVICYPADDDVDPRSGDRTRTQVIIRGSEADIESLQRLDEDRRAARSPNGWDRQYAITCELARRAGAEHGRAAASWYFDGNTPDETYRIVLRGIEQGDPAVLDTFPSSPLSGEWADEPLPRDVLEDLDVDEDDDAAQDYLRAYEDGFHIASSDAIERAARYQVFTVEPYAWPGGYPIGYLMADGGWLCARCVSDPSNPLRLTDSGDPSDAQWTLTGSQVLEGGPEDYDGAVTCSHCGAVLISDDEEDR